MPNWAKGEFRPTNPQKYVGKSPIIFRSSWELPMMKVFDTDPSILQWASETVSIPYQHPFLKTNTGARKWSMYIPDFFVLYIDKAGKKHAKLVEIKPEDEMPGWAGRVNTHKKAAQAVNYAKWQAALAYCVRRNWEFQVASDKQLFAYTRKV